MSSAWRGLTNDLVKTEIPDYAINQSLPADSYFTSDETARKCFSILSEKLKNENITLDDYTFIEPSAGAGAFYNLLPNDKRIGIELHGRSDEYIKKDYLTWKPDNTKGKYIVVGNPPFGIRGAYALAFVNRSFLFSDYVAFILPMSFHSNGKGSNMKRITNGHLISSQILEQERFYSPDNDKEIKVNTLFQIWKKGKGKSIFTDYDISEYVDIYTVCASPDRLCGLDKIEIYDFYVTSSYYGDSLKTVYEFNDVKYKTGYGIIIKKQKDKILSLIKDVEWNDYCSLATTNVKHIRKHSIEECLFNLGFGKEIEQTINPLEKFMSKSLDKRQELEYNILNK